MKSRSIETVSHLEYLPISGLVPHPDNPRHHSPKQVGQIAESIKTFGFRIPVVVDANNRIICGHGRVLACRRLGLDTVPALRAGDLNDAQIRAFMIADNRLTEIADWDDALLGDNFKILSELDLEFDLEVTGFDYGDIELLMTKVEGPSPDPTDNLDQFENVPPTVQPGDLWQLGPHRLICGDGTQAETYKRLLGNQKAGVVFTDPPYNLSAKDIGKVCAEQHGDFAVAAGEMSIEAFTEFLATVFGQLSTFSRSGSIHYVCMDWRHLQEILQAGQAQYTELKNLCVWAKDRAGMGSFYRSQHELVFVFKNGQTKHQNHFHLGQHGRNRSNLWTYPSSQSMDPRDGDPAGKEGLKLHPTIKPVKMIEEALRDCSMRGQIVLDPFLGSGSTLIAAEKSQRRCYGIELSPRYLDVAISRWQAWTGRSAVHAGTGQPFTPVRKAG